MSKIKSMVVGVTGATGFLGREICGQLGAAGCRIVAFSRSAGSPPRGCDELRSFPTDRPSDFSGLDAVIHLAGENVFGRWTEAKKERILRSRVDGTQLVTQACAAGHGPNILLSASATGFYGDTGESGATEATPVGSGFLAGVASAWEQAAAAAGSQGVRVACVRLGMILGAGGGAMRLVRPVFRAGLGGRLGSGRQWMAPVHIADAAGIFLHLLGSENLIGPFNAVLPEPVRNRDFTKAVARAARRPAVFPAPAPLLRLVLGELSSLLLSNQRVQPAATLKSGYCFKFPGLSEGLRNVFAEG